MASLGPGNYVLVILPVGGLKASDTKLVSQREPRDSKTWFLAGLILPNEAHVDVVVHELFEETSLSLTGTMYAYRTVQHELVHVFSTSVHVPYVCANLPTPTKVEQVVTAQSIVHSDGTYTVPSIVDIDGSRLRRLGLALPRRLKVSTSCTSFWLLRGSMGIFSRRCDSRQLFLR
jgi:hypothetical protein